jgi:enolase
MLDLIWEIRAHPVLDSRSYYTLETKLETPRGLFRASVPHGGSKGSLEAVELPAMEAIRNVNTRIAPYFLKMALEAQPLFDQRLRMLDGTPNKSRLGANAILSVSLAACRANASHEEKHLYEYLHGLAKTKKMVLPVPFMNVLNGGKHAGLENDIQETMIVPHRFKSFSNALGAGTAVFHSLRKLLHQKYGAIATLVGDEGGFVPQQARNLETRLELLEKAVEQTGFSKRVSFAVDAAATQFFNAKKNHYRLGKKRFSVGELADYYSGIVKSFPVVSLEDGFAENDWIGWKALNKKLGKKIQLVGDDLLVTNSERIREAIQKKACNALLLKPNQVGTVSEAIQAVQLAYKNGWNVMVSHRSGETNDSFIADLAVGIGCGECKFGAPDRGERIAKYNRLLQIEEQLGKKARFARDVV